MTKTVELILQHGWGFDSQAWNGWLNHISETNDFTFLTQTPDRGYFGLEVNQPSFQLKNSVKVLVTHSLGMHFVSEDLLEKVDLLVSFSPFGQFEGLEELPNRRSKRTLKLMLDTFNISPRQALEEFYETSFRPLATRQTLFKRGMKTLAADRLGADLEFLNNQSLDLDKLAAVPHIFLMHGSADEIVSKNHSRALKQVLPYSSYIEFEEAGHSLPLTHVAPCWFALQSSIKEFALATKTIH